MEESLTISTAENPFSIRQLSPIVQDSSDDYTSFHQSPISKTQEHLQPIRTVNAAYCKVNTSNQASTKSTSANILTKGADARFSCQYCDKRFRHRTHIWRHLLRRESSALINETTYLLITLSKILSIAHIRAAVAVISSPAATKLWATSKEDALYNAKIPMALPIRLMHKLMRRDNQMARRLRSQKQIIFILPQLMLIILLILTFQKPHAREDTHPPPSYPIIPFFQQPPAREGTQPPPFVVKDMTYREIHRSPSLSRLSRSSSFSEMVNKEPSPPRPLSRSNSFRDPLPSELQEPPDRPASAPTDVNPSSVMQWMESDDYLQGWSVGYTSRPQSRPQSPTRVQSPSPPPLNPQDVDTLYPGDTLGLINPSCGAWQIA